MFHLILILVSISMTHCVSNIILVYQLITALIKSVNRFLVLILFEYAWSQVTTAVELQLIKFVLYFLLTVQLLKVL